MLVFRRFVAPGAALCLLAASTLVFTGCDDKKDAKKDDKKAATDPKMKDDKMMDGKMKDDKMMDGKMKDDKMMDGKMMDGKMKDDKMMKDK
jgi:hypothetical protein